MTTWLVIRAATRMEGRAVKSLKEIGLYAYSPTRTVWCRTGKERTPKPMPLFPGYAFVLLPEGRGTHGIREADGVHNFVWTMGVERHPATIPSNYVEGLIQAEAEGLFDETLKPDWSPAKGERVRVTDGPMSGWVGKVVKLKGDKRLRVLFEVMGQAVTVQRGMVEAA